MFFNYLNLEALRRRKLIATLTSSISLWSPVLRPQFWHFGCCHLGFLKPDAKSERLIWQTNWRHHVHKLATHQRKLRPTTWLIFFLVGPQFARRTSCCIHCDLKLLTETMYLSEASTEVRGQMSLMIASEKLEASLFRLQSQISFSFYIQHMERLPNRNHWINRYKSQIRVTVHNQ